MFKNSAQLNLNSQLEEVFKKGSKTYFYSSLFFPTEIRQKINILYAFVRIADDLVDSVPADKLGFWQFKNYYLNQKNFQNKLEIKTAINKLEIEQSSETKKVEIQIEIQMKISEFHQKIIDGFIALENELQFEPSWALAFLESMESDLEPRIYQNLTETQKYIYGSANVIGLFMAKILDLPPESYYFAEHLGMSFQYINFIRDIDEDLVLGRSYFPADLLQSCGLTSLKLAETGQKPENFRNFVREILNQYEKWQEIGENGFHFFPQKYRVAIKTASDMYKWTGFQIAKDPFTVYQKKIKPQKRRVLLTGIRNWLY